MLLSTPTISQHLHEDSAHAKTATVPSDLWRTTS